MIQGTTADPIGTRFIDCTFDSFSVTRLNHDAVDACRRLSTGKGGGVVLIGSVGTGKTHLLTALAKAYEQEEEGEFDENSVYKITQRCRVVEFWPILDLVSDLRAEIRHGDCMISERCRKCDLLILDDFGEERSTDFVLEELERIIDTRYRNLKPIAVSTNLKPAQIAQKYGERAISRWAESCEIVELGGDDYRMKKVTEVSGD